MKKPILILGCVFPEDLEAAVRQDISIAVYSYELARKLSEIGNQFQKDVAIHIKVDTGMGRLGFPVGREFSDTGYIEEIERISKLPRIRLEGLFTHFARADEVDQGFTHLQLKRFGGVIDSLRQRGIAPPLLHCSNSAGIIGLPEAHMNMVRAGISLYGLWPSEEVDRGRIRLQPALSLISQVAFVKELQEGEPISYGGTYRVQGKKRIATIPVGYGDGYPRSLSNKGFCLIRGQRAAILGRVCMDYFMADVTDIEGAREGDQVTLIGVDGGEQITVEQLAELSGRFNYEFVCCLSKRIPREHTSL